MRKGFAQGFKKVVEPVTTFRIWKVGLSMGGTLLKIEAAVKPDYQLKIVRCGYVSRQYTVVQMPESTTFLVVTPKYQECCRVLGKALIVPILWLNKTVMTQAGSV